MQNSQICNQNPSSDEKLATLLTEHEVARLVGMSVAAIRRWRLLNAGPPYLKLNHSIRYDPRALRDWLASRPTGGERAEGAKHA